MKKPLTDRPLVFVDVETTGLSPTTDRIVELSLLKVKPDGSEELMSRRVNPGMPIPAEATSIHGVTDDDVAGEPEFPKYATSIRDFLEDCDIAGFNVIKFDLSVLEAEFKRADVEFSRGGRRVVDAQVIYHKMHPRDLIAAYRTYCGKELENAHTSEADVRATAEVLAAQLETHQDLPKDVDELHSFCNPTGTNWVDSEGKFLWVDGECALAFSRKHKGRSLRHVAADDPGFLHWMLGKDFSEEVKEIVSKALDGQFPDRPEAQK